MASKKYCLPLACVMPIHNEKICFSCISQQPSGFVPGGLPFVEKIINLITHEKIIQLDKEVVLG